MTFMSPGSFFDETSTKPIESWDTKTAVAMASAVTERYGSRPYGFRFSTGIISDDVPDGEGGYMKVQPKQVADTGVYYIDGRLRTAEDVIADDKQGEMALRSNMRINHIAIVCETTNGYRHTAEFGERDSVVSSSTGSVTARGDDKEREEYRKRWNELCRRMDGREAARRRSP